MVIVYSAVPIEADGFEVTTKGTLPRPSMKIANADGAITALLNAYNPLRAEVRRIRTCKKFLDSANFPTLFFVTQTDDQLITQSGDSLFSGEGLNPAADPTAVFNGGYESWYIDRVATENPQVVEFELVGKLDLTNLRLPARQVVEHCPWIYKGIECGYKPGKRFNRSDLNQELADDADSDDQCAKNLTACELRHPKDCCHLEGSQVQDFRSDAEQHALRCARKKLVVLSLMANIGRVAMLQTTLALTLRLIRETTQQHRFWNG